MLSLIIFIFLSLWVLPLQENTGIFVNQPSQESGLNIIVFSLFSLPFFYLFYETLSRKQKGIMSAALLVIEGLGVFIGIISLIQMLFSLLTIIAGIKVLKELETLEV